jgi:hemolysin activation/secretion protein
VSLEWQVQLTGLAETPPETWQVQLAVFGDYGGGKNNDPLPGEEENVDFSGWGAGLQLDLDLARGQSLQARVDGATQITDRDPSNGDDWQWWGRLEYQFW